jgi:hypothetical protein
LELLASVLQEDVQKGLVNFHTSRGSAVQDEAQVPEFVHEQIDGSRRGTSHVGIVKTQYGDKDMQKFVFSVKQFDEENTPQTVEIHQQYYRSTHKTATLVKFLTALDINIDDVNQNGIDFETLIGKKLQIRVLHHVDAKNVKHANVLSIPPRRKSGGVQ